MKNIYRNFRKFALFNRVFRSVVRFLGFRLPQSIRSKVAPHLPVAGSFSFKLKNGIGINFLSKADDNIANILYYDPSGYEEYNELMLFSELAKKSRTILDIGANTGIFTVIAGASNRNANIYAFEPYKVNADRLRQNVALNQLSKVTVVEKAVGDSLATINFTVPSEGRICDVLSANDSFTRKFYSKEIKYEITTVEQTTIDSLNLDNVDLVKIDVESYEIAVFKGAVNTLRKFSPVILCEIFVDPVRDAFYKEFLKDLGYYIYMHLPSGLVLTENLEDNRDSRNFVFSKGKTSQVYTSFRDIEKMCLELGSGSGSEV